MQRHKANTDGDRHKTERQKRTDRRIDEPVEVQTDRLWSNTIVMTSETVIGQDNNNGNQNDNLKVRTTMVPDRQTTEGRYRDRQADTDRKSRWTTGWTDR